MEALDRLRGDLAQTFTSGAPLLTSQFSDDARVLLRIYECAEAEVVDLQAEVTRLRAACETAREQARLALNLMQATRGSIGLMVTPEGALPEPLHDAAKETALAINHLRKAIVAADAALGRRE